MLILYNIGDATVLYITRMAFGTVCESTTWVQLEFCEMLWHLLWESQLYPKAQERADPSDVAALQGDCMATSQGNTILPYCGCARATPILLLLTVSLSGPSEPPVSLSAPRSKFRVWSKWQVCQDNPSYFPPDYWKICLNSNASNSKNIISKTIKIGKSTAFCGP